MPRSSVGVPFSYELFGVLAGTRYEPVLDGVAAGLTCTVWILQPKHSSPC